MKRQRVVQAPSPMPRKLNVWTMKAGQERRGLQVLCEAIMSPRHARAVTNGTPKEMKESKPELEAEAGNPDEPFDDDIPY